ncbi:MAG TPA: hypothetical protein VLW55_11930 [Burkholderiaceae bacterium]|nr:hypothetical protein [Burkholderiaceae bacterium]
MKPGDSAATRALDARLAAAPCLALAVLAVGALFIAAAMSIVDVAPAGSERPEAFEAQQDDSLQAFVAQRYGTAYGRFAAFADEDRTPSALLALALTRPNSFASRQRLADRAP